MMVQVWGPDHTVHYRLPEADHTVQEAKRLIATGHGRGRGYELVYCDAEFSPCRTWRYTQTRTWDAARPTLNVVGLNPSTADEVLDDPTIRRCLGYARRWGFGQLVMTNVFAFRATDPRLLRQADDPVGPKNDDWLGRVAEDAARVVVAWGGHGTFRGRSAQVQVLLGARFVPLYCLGRTQDGEPRHPLYLRADLEMLPFAELPDL